MTVSFAAGYVRDCMALPVPAIASKTGIATALRLLREHRAEALPVLDGACFVGLVDEAALLRFTPSEATTLDVYELREVLERLTVARATVRTEAVAPGAPLSAVVAAMCRARARVLPVVEKGRLVGLLPWTRLLAAASGEPVQLCA